MNVQTITLFPIDDQREVGKLIALYPDYREYTRRKREIFKMNLSQEEEDYEIRNLIDELGI